MRQALYSWERFVDAMRSQLDQRMERMADAIKDALLDWSTPEEEEGGAAEGPALSPLCPDQFVEALRGNLEETLRRVAGVLNETPDGRLSGAAGDHICELVAQFVSESLEVGLRMRWDGAEEADAPLMPPQGDWASRFRSMQRESRIVAPQVHLEDSFSG